MIEALLMGGKKPAGINDLFSTTLYTGTGGTQSINTGVNLAINEGLVWIKDRNLSNKSHYLYDTERGGSNLLSTNSTSGQIDGSPQRAIVFSNNGFDLPIENQSEINGAGQSYVSWSLRSHPGFFDVVKYTGDGIYDRDIDHDLGEEAGFIIVKKVTGSGSWATAPASQLTGVYAYLGSSSAPVTGSNVTNGYPYYFPLSGNTSSQFRVKSLNSSLVDVNQAGDDYIAYIFPLGDSESLARSGVYSGTGSTGTANTVTLGWEPQFLVIKRRDSTGDWFLIDNKRAGYLRSNTNGPEVNTPLVEFLPTGFKPTNTLVNASGSNNYIYLAIRGES